MLRDASAVTQRNVAGAFTPGQGVLSYAEAEYTATESLLAKQVRMKTHPCASSHLSQICIYSRLAERQVPLSQSRPTCPPVIAIDEAMQSPSPWRARAGLHAIGLQEGPAAHSIKRFCKAVIETACHPVHRSLFT